MTGRRVTGGAAPQNQATTPGSTRGAQPTTNQPKPASPPSGPSGVSPSANGSR
jgi:hypothetical protein